MTTMHDIINRAYRKINISGAGETLDAEMADEGLDALNDMLHGWKLRGVDLLHTDLGLTDPFPLAAEFREGTYYVLASRLSPNYQIPPSFDPDKWFRAIQAAYLVIPTAIIPRGARPRRTDDVGF